MATQQFGWFMLTLLVVWLAGFTPVMAHADVTGSFGIEITLIPAGTQTAATKFFIDVQSNLQLDVTLSGLTVGVDARFGVSGIEFTTLRLTTTLGALEVFDEFVFATPFYNSSTSDPVTTDEIHPTRIQGSNVNNGPAFVKKRITLTLNVAGLTLTNLAIFEDVDFPNPLKYINPNYNPNGVDSMLDTGGRGLANQTPSFGLGDVITISGQTVSGIQISSSTGICVQLEANVIKKRSWPESVNPACGAMITSGGTSSSLLFDFESLKVENVTIGAITIDSEIFWRPLVTSAKSEVSFNVLGLADVVLTFESNNIANLSLDMVTVDVKSDNLSFSAFDVNGDLSFDLLKAQFSVTLNPNQSPASLKIAGLTLVGAGLVFGEVVLSVDRNPISYALTTVFDTSAGFTGIAWNFTRFNLGAETSIFNVEATSTATAVGLSQVTFRLGVLF